MFFANDSPANNAGFEDTGCPFFFGEKKKLKYGNRI
jgi:hypothetical protein